MADYATLKAAIQAVIYENGNQEITGDVMQSTLLAMVNSLGAGYQCMGVATPETNPGTPDQRVFYFAYTAGTYTNFGGIVVNEGEVCLLTYDTTWAKQIAINGSGFATKEEFNELSKKVTDISESSENLIQLQDVTRAFQGTTVQTFRTGRFKVTGTASHNGGRVNKQCTPFTLPAGSYRMVLSNTPVVSIFLEKESGNTIIVSGEGTFTLNAATSVYIGINTTNGVIYNDDFGIAIYSDQNNTQYAPTITANDFVAREQIKKVSGDVTALTTRVTNAEDGITNLQTDVAVNVNRKVFTTNADANKVIRHLFIDTSGYTGSYSLTGLRLRNLYNDGTNQCGFVIENESRDLIANKWYDLDVPIQEYISNGVYVYAELNWDNFPAGTDRILAIPLTNEVFQAYNDPRLKSDSEFILGAAGDSITYSSGYPINNNADPFNPISGGKNKSWAYFIAKQYGMKWHNYGNSGSTLGDCVVANYDQRGFSKASGRYTQMADDLTHITIWFGWNDAYYGPRMQKQMWVQATYENTHWYPPNNDASFIGQPGYVTQEEYDAVNSVTGVVGGITYNDSQEYWNAVYVGTKDDTTNKTYWGAWNIVLPYLINKYPYAKILLISPYGTNELMRQAVRDAAFKYGLQCYDFGKDQNQMFAYGWQDESEQGQIGSISVEQFRTNRLLSDGTHPNLEGNKYLYPSIGAKLMAL